MSSRVHSSSSGEKTLDAGLASPGWVTAWAPSGLAAKKQAGPDYGAGAENMCCCWDCFWLVGKYDQLAVEVCGIRSKKRKIVSGTEIDSRTRMHSRNAFVCAICREEKGA